jgi:hypothetical protein
MLLARLLLGLRCTIYVLGVNDNRGSFDPWPPSEASVYPFSGLGLIGGLGSAFFGALGTNSADVTSLLTLYQGETGGVDVVGFSGGAQVISNVVASNPGLASGIASTTYLSPGVSPFFGAWLYQAPNSKSFKGSGIADFVATLGARMQGVQLEATGTKGHNFDGEFSSGPVQQRLNNFPGSRGSCTGGRNGSASTDPTSLNPGGFGNWWPLVCGYNDEGSFNCYSLFLLP